MNISNKNSLVALFQLFSCLFHTLILADINVYATITHQLTLLTTDKVQFNR